MGTAQSNHDFPPPTHEELLLLVATTHYEEAEILQLFDQFIESSSGGVLKFSTFQAVAFTCGVYSAEAARLLFRAFDANHDGMITFAEFVRGLSAMTRGSNEEKLVVAFRMYDVDGDGLIHFETLQSNLQALEQALGPLRPYHGATEPGGNAQVNEVCADMMSRCLQGHMDFAQFVQYATRSPSVVRALGLQ